jgi:hypothetical protein
MEMYADLPHARICICTSKKSSHFKEVETKAKFVGRKRAQNYHYLALSSHWLLSGGMGECCCGSVTVYV